MVLKTEKFFFNYRMYLRKGMQTLSQDQSGFTLLELIVSIILLGILLSFSVGIIALNGEAVKRIYIQSSGSAEVRNTFRQMRADLQRLSADSILHALPNRLTYYDINGIYINYHMIGNNLLRNDRIILYNLNQAPFSYRDKNFQQISSPVNAIKYVEVQLFFSKNEQTFRFTDIFYVRN